MKLPGSIRLSIESLLPWADQIAGCRSFEDLFALVFPNGGRELQTAMGENFADEYCIQYAPAVGFADFRPATGKEDWEEGTDAVGATHRFAGGDTPAPALRQDKAYNPFNPQAKLDLKDLAGLLVPLAQGKVRGNHTLIFTTLFNHQLSLGVRKAFPWVVTREHYERELSGNRRFFADFAARIRKESKDLERRRARNLDYAENKLMAHQRAAVAHVAKRRTSFVCLPPGSGKTEIQSRVAEKWLRDHPVTVYVAPTLALLDQNFYKVARHCRRRRVLDRVIMACSAKDFSLHSADRGILRRNEIVFGSVGGDEVRDALCLPGRKLVGTTYKSYPRLVEFCSERNLPFDRIADEALEAIPSRESGHADSSKDIKEREELWKAFSNMSIVNRSACFDAFERIRPGSEEASGIEVGTNNVDVFGGKFKRTFADMIKVGTIVPPRVRVLLIDAEDMKKMEGYNQPGWTDDDKINFTALCRMADHVIQDRAILNKKIVAFMHRARVCPRFVEPLRRYLRGTPIKYADAIVADTDDRHRILDRYGKADHACLVNFGILGRGIDNSTTNAVFVGRNMASVYGMHGVHRPCRSHADEFGLPPAQHRKKPCGYVYVAVLAGDLATGEQSRDMEAILKELYKALGTWQDDFEVVRAVHSNDGELETISRPDSVQAASKIDPISALYDRIQIFEADFKAAEEKRADKLSRMDRDAGMDAFEEERKARAGEEPNPHDDGMDEYEGERRKRGRKPKK